MNDFILSEVSFFLASFLWGALLFFVYDQFVILRKVIPHPKFIIAVEDLIFWITAGILIFRMMYQMNDGVIRYYAIISVILGMKLYQVTIGKLFVYVGSRIGLWIKKQIKRFFHIIATPIRLLLKQVKRFLRFIGSVIKKRITNVCSFATNKLKKSWKKVKIKRKERLNQKTVKEDESVKVRGVLEPIAQPIKEGEWNEEDQTKKKKRA